MSGAIMGMIAEVNVLCRAIYMAIGRRTIIKYYTSAHFHTWAMQGMINTVNSQPNGGSTGLNYDGTISMSSSTGGMNSHTVIWRSPLVNLTGITNATVEWEGTAGSNNSTNKAYFGVTTNASPTYNTDGSAYSRNMAVWSKTTNNRSVSSISGDYYLYAGYYLGDNSLGGGLKIHDFLLDGVRVNNALPFRYDGDSGLRLRDGKNGTIIALSPLINPSPRLWEELYHLKDLHNNNLTLDILNSSQVPIVQDVSETYDMTSITEKQIYLKATFTRAGGTSPVLTLAELAYI